jgi:hypothetical protein
VGNRIGGRSLARGRADVALRRVTVETSRGRRVPRLPAATPQPDAVPPVAPSFRTRLRQAGEDDSCTDGLALSRKSRWIRFERIPVWNSGGVEKSDDGRPQGAEGRLADMQADSFGTLGLQLSMSLILAQLVGP